MELSTPFLLSYKKNRDNTAKTNYIGFIMRELLINKFIFAVAIIMLMAGCSSSDLNVENEYPVSQEDARRARHGSLTGDGLKLFGGNSDEGKTSGSSVGIGINSYLWRATLDTLSFMPFASADPFGGVVITDWYEDPNARGEKFKVNVLILDQELHANAIKVTIFKQVNTSGKWRDATPNTQLAVDLENKILVRARSLKVEKESKE